MKTSGYTKIAAAALTAIALAVFWRVLPREDFSTFAAEVKHPYAASIAEQSGELRGTLSDANKELYDVVKAGLLERRDEILVRRFTYEEQDIQDVMWYIMQDSPEIFWVEWKWDVRSQDDGFTVIPSYIFAKEEIEPKRAELETALVELAAAAETAGATGSDLDKTRFVHDTLINTCAYLEGSDDPIIHTSYGALVKRGTVCDGYAHAARLLLARLGVECRYVEGSATGDGITQGHAWNIVKVDGGFHHMDITWDDGDHKTDDDEDSNVVSYTYFLVGDDEIALDHTIENKATLPACADYGYFAKMGLSGALFEDIADGVEAALLENVKNGRYFIQFRITDADDFAVMSDNETFFSHGMTDVVDDVNASLKSEGLSARVDGRTVKCYQDDERQILLVIFSPED